MITYNMNMNMRGHQDVLIYLRRHNLKMFIVATCQKELAKGTCQPVKVIP